MSEDSGGFIHVAREYNKSVDSISENLTYIKHELTKMQKQDVKLLRQLIQINDVIHILSRKLGGTDKPYIETDFFDPENKTTSRVIRQQSVPDYFNYHRKLRLTSSVESSFEDIEENEEDTTSLFSNEENQYTATEKNTRVPVQQIKDKDSDKSDFRPRSHSYGLKRCESQRYDDIHMAELLEKNIKLWKKTSSLKSSK